MEMAMGITLQYTTSVVVEQHVHSEQVVYRSCTGRVANPRPVTTIKTCRVAPPITDAFWRDPSWLWRPVLDLQHALDQPASTAIIKCGYWLWF